MVVPAIRGFSVGGILKKLARPLIGGGIGDRMDKGNLWIFPIIILFPFLCLWTLKWTNVTLEESTCRTSSTYDFTGTQLDLEAKKHCQTGRHYYVAQGETFPKDLKSRKEREVENPEWVLWFWVPILFLVCITRFIWSLLMDNQGIDFPNVMNTSKSVANKKDGFTKIDKIRLEEELGVIAENFQTASSRVFAAFIFFQFILVLTPLILLFFILPMMIGSNYRTWGLDVARAIWEHREWQGVSLAPLIGNFTRPHVPLIPRITYCDYHFVSMSNSHNTHTITYRCFLDANWLERTALFIWIMLFFLTFANFINLLCWIGWAIRMKFKKLRQRWVMRNWLNNDEAFEVVEMEKFAAEFRTGQLLLFYSINSHTNRAVASAFCQALFRRWLKKQKRTNGSDGGDSPINKNTKEGANDRLTGTEPARKGDGEIGKKA